MRVYGWMAAHKPLVDVITDGSGPDRASRLDSTRKLIEGCGGRLGGIAGAYPDRDFYGMIKAGDPAPFLGLAAGFARQWQDADISVVAGDMLEGFSPTHDVCRMMIDAAVEKLRRRGRDILNLEFPLESMALPGAKEGAVVVPLDDAGFAEKQRSAKEAYPELAGEVDRLIAKLGEDAFRIEVLLPAKPPNGLTWDGPEPPFYETYGRRQVEAGHYQDLITFAGHLQPLARALWQWACDDTAAL